MKDGNPDSGRPSVILVPPEPLPFAPMISPAIVKTTPPPVAGFREAFDTCVAKTRGNLPAMVKSGTTWAFDADGMYDRWPEGFFEIGNWTTSFFTGMGLLAWLGTGEKDFLTDLKTCADVYAAKVEGAHAANTMHDLGFLYSLQAVALYQTTGGTRFRETGLRAAETLAARFVEKGGYIRAWGRMDETEYEGLAIIDCLMNMPLLYWATRETDEARFREMAVRHTDTTLEHFVREDGSVYHAYRFSEDGKPVAGDNHCGNTVESHWARGAAWAMYGLAAGYKHTGDPRYLEGSLKVARKFVASLDGEMVPVWDFRLAKDGEPLRDSSAAAISVCAIQLLEEMAKADASLAGAKDGMLERLVSPDYLDTDPARQGVLKHGQVGDGVGRAKAAYTSWGDYFLMEALARELGIGVTWW